MGMSVSKIFLCFHRLCRLGYFVGICKEEGARGTPVPVAPPLLPSRYSGRVRCKRDSGQGRRREKFSTGSWNVVRTDVTRTENYLKMFQLGRGGRFVPICIIIARTFNTGIKSLLGSTETIAVDANFFESCKFRVEFLFFFWLELIGRSIRINSFFYFFIKKRDVLLSLILFILYTNRWIIYMVSFGYAIYLYIFRRCQFKATIGINSSVIHFHLVVVSANASNCTHTSFV